jgi:serine/threonine protein kinase
VARLSHPNIVTLHDVGYEDQGGWHYLVLEHIPGQDLDRTMTERGGRLPVHEALHAIRGTLSALAFAHARSIVHRDIKPENIMITPDGQVKVTDFGLALARGDVRLTKAGMIVGTVLYMAPETITGAPVDPRADLYAVGAVLYELLTGQPPFTGEDPMVILSQVLNVPVAPPRTLEPSISQEVERIVVRLPGQGSRRALRLGRGCTGGVVQPGRIGEPGHNCGTAGPGRSRFPPPAGAYRPRLIEHAAPATAHRPDHA